MGLSKRLARLEEVRGPSDPDARMAEVLSRMTDEELEAYVAALDEAEVADAPERFPYADGPIARRVERLWEETADGRRT